MHSAGCEPDDPLLDAALETVPIGPGQLERIDDNLHFGWSWHRYRYVYRPSERLRILDATGDTGLTALGLARLNPGATVLGIVPTPRGLELSRQRAEASPGLNVAFQQHDLATPLPAEWGAFDYIVCRERLHRVADPAAVLAVLAHALDPRGLLLATVPGRGFQHAAAQLRRAVRVLHPDGSAPADQAATARLLFEALRPDHPWKALERLATASDRPGPARLSAAYLTPPRHDWDLEDGVAMLNQAGLRFLYAGSGVPWQPERIFLQGVPGELQERVARLDDAGRAALIDILNPSANLVEHRLYACPAAFEPHVPSWSEGADPEALAGLIPHRTGLVVPASPTPEATPVLYRVVTGQVGPLDPVSDALLHAIDDRTTCAALSADVERRLGRAEAPIARRQRWLELANRGFVLLEPADPRQQRDCIHLGPVRDRLDCPCPKKWVRACARHTFCTWDRVADHDPNRPAYERALARLAIPQVMACSQCADYEPEAEIVVKNS